MGNGRYRMARADKLARATVATFNPDALLREIAAPTDAETFRRERDRETIGRAMLRAEREYLAGSVRNA